MQQQAQTAAMPMPQSNDGDHKSSTQKEAKKVDDEKEKAAKPSEPDQQVD